MTHKHKIELITMSDINDFVQIVIKETGSVTVACTLQTPLA